MKKLLTLTMVCFCMAANGQIDSIRADGIILKRNDYAPSVEPIKNSRIIVDTLGYNDSLLLFIATPDTVRVIMLACDTADQKDDQVLILSNGPVYTKPKAGFLFWGFGYIVNKWDWWRSPNEFLDADKKPLPKSVIVWDYKITNQ